MALCDCISGSSHHASCSQSVFYSTATSFAPNVPARSVVIDLTVRISSSINPPSDCGLDPHIWHRVEKDLYLHISGQSAWLYLALASEEQLTAEDLLVMDIRVGEQPPKPSSDPLWESRPCGIWVLRRRSFEEVDKAVTGVDILFGADAVDPRPRWTLIPSPLQLNTSSKVLNARLSVLCGRVGPRSDPPAALRVREDGKFKIVQISDTHMVTDVGICNDAIDAHGDPLPESEADPLTGTSSIMISLIPNLPCLKWLLLSYSVQSDSRQSLAIMIVKACTHCLLSLFHFANLTPVLTDYVAGTAQMSILRDLPFSLCESGPQQIDGIGNFYLQLLAPAPSQLPLSTLYFLDSHGQAPSETSDPDYEPIKQSQIDWFVSASQEQRSTREKDDCDNSLHLSLAFLHIPVPEFADRDLHIHSGHRRESTECPRINSHFYDALVEAGISALGCGHDHVNDFCALLPPQPHQHGEMIPKLGPWLCYGGGSGFGGYCSYGEKRYYRRMRVWELDTIIGSLKTWMRVEYAIHRVDELVLVDGGKVVCSPEKKIEGKHA